MKNTLVWIFSLCAFFCAAGSGFAAPAKTVVDVSIDGEISAAQTYILNRAVAAAAEISADALLIDLNTPGGDLQATLRLMEAVSNFKGKTICYVNTDAISAGSFIAMACDEIWFAPKGVMGAAEAVNGDMSDIPETMKRKLESFLDAKLRVLSSASNPNRLKVHRAMTNPKGDFSLGGVSKHDGELLTLTADSASQSAGGFPIMADGVAGSKAELLRKSLKTGSENIRVKTIELSGFEIFAKRIAGFSQILVAIALFLIFADLKSGGLGVLGAIGGALLALVFFGAHIAGLSGYSAIILAGIGAALIVADIWLGSAILMIAGALFLIFALLIYSVDPEIFAPPLSLSDCAAAANSALWNFIMSLALASVLLFFFGKFIKKTPLWKKFVLEGGLKSGDKGIVESGLAGQRGVVIAELVPNGKVEIGGVAYDASSADSSFIGKGEEVEVLGAGDFQIKVKRTKER